MSAWRPAILGHVRNDLEYRDGRGPDWRTDAACAQVDPELFHPNKGARATEAKAICRTCPALESCLEWALTATPHPDGIWAGTSERERRDIRRERNQTEREAS